MTKPLFVRFCVLLILLFNFAITSNAEVWVVDQDTSNQAADYPQLQAAIDAAQDGDTIYVMGAAAKYEGATVNKSLTLIGAGVYKNISFPAASSLESFMEQIIITANDVFVTGFHFTAELRVLAPSQNVTLFRNFFNHEDYNGALEAAAVETPQIATKIHNLHVINNIFRATTSSVHLVKLFDTDLAAKSIYTEVVGLVFANNILWNRGLFLVPSGSVKIFNNYFGLNRVGFWARKSDNSRIQASGNFYNNLVNDPYYDQGNLVRRNNAHNKWSGYDSIFSDSSNIEYTQLSEVVRVAGNLWEELALTDDSILKGAGLNGEDIGIFDGPHAWNPNFQPPVPIITRLQAPHIVGSGENLGVQIEVQPNN